MVLRISDEIGEVCLADDIYLNVLDPTLFLSWLS